MKKYFLLFLVFFLSISCSSQNNDTKKEGLKQQQENITEQPKGNWTVDKVFDKDGNLIRYDSIYSWSSNSKYDNLSSFERDSILNAFKSKFFSNFSDFKNHGFDDVFTKDSLFSKYFFNDQFFKSDFGKDFMDIDKFREQMIARQKAFLEKYQSEIIKPKK